MCCRVMEKSATSVSLNISEQWLLCIEVMGPVQTNFEILYHISNKSLVKYTQEICLKIMRTSRVV